MAEQMDTITWELKAMLDNPPSTIESIREGWDGLMEKVIAGLASVPGVVRTSVDAGGVAAEWFEAPDFVEFRTVLYLHGGGYVMGRVQTHRDLIARVAVVGRARVLALDYVLAPEKPFPAGIDDVIAAYRWLLAEGHDPKHIAVVGDSAGGGLALAALAKIGTLPDVPMPAVGIAISPWLDFEALGSSMETNADSDLFNSREVVLRVSALYTGGGDPKVASPLYAVLSELPPLLLIAGGDEVLVDDSRRFSEAARRQGVSVHEEIYDGLYHDFPLFEPTDAPGMSALQHVGKHLDAYL